jgi:glycosyltransferase involved in cell wall biosynthesis
MNIMQNKKRKILFVIPGFHIGGTIVSLNNLLSLLDTTRFDIDLFALQSSGIYKNKMKNCKILADDFFFSSELSSNNLFDLIAFFIIRVTRKVLKIIGIKGDVLFWKFGAKSFIKKNYDVVISYQEGGVTEIARYIPAKKYIAWVQSDYSRYLSLTNSPNELPLYKKYAHVVCASDYSKKIMQNCLPGIKDRIISIHNIIDYTTLREASQSTEDLDPRFKTNIFSIISVGRIDPVKQFEKIPSIVAQIKENDIPFRWYLIGGYGDQTIRQNITENTKKEKVEEEYILLGEKPNVYQYIAKANLLVSTSLSESYPLVIQEARVLGIPVIANNFDSAYESVEEGKSGFVLPIENMAEKIIELMTDDSKLSELKNYVTQYKFDNETILKQICELFES